MICIIKKNEIVCSGLIFFVNAILFLVNILLLIADKHKFIFQNIIVFKNSDFSNIHLSEKSYNYISSYLLNKYKADYQTNKKHNYFQKKVVKVKSTGLFNKTLHSIWLNNKLENNFNLKFEEQNPDYLIYNVFDNEDKNPNYHNAIRIAIYTENVMPDINYADYIISHYHINYLDRCFKYNVFLWENSRNIDKKRKEVIKSPIRKKFCAAIISNCQSKFRLDFINKLSKYKKVDMGGKCLNNIDRKIKDKIKFLTEYKFSIAMENSYGDGYISEKIIHSFLAGTLPIYYGDYIIDEYINPKTFILIKGEKDIDSKIEYIKKIDNDNELYLSILKQKPIVDDNYRNRIDNTEIKLFLKNIFNQEKENSFRRDDNFYDFNCNDNN